MVNIFQKLRKKIKKLFSFAIFFFLGL